MKRVFIIHGWTGKPNQHWTPWLENKLKEKGFDVYQPEMPETDNPKMNLWTAYLKEQVGKADLDTYFVGHSIGCLTILRYLEKYNEKIGGAVLVAPWVTLNPESFVAPEDKEVVEAWTSGGFDWEKLKNLCHKFVALFSKDDPDVPLDDNMPIFKEELGAKIIIEDGKGHFTSEEDVNELPVVLEQLLKMSN